MIHEAQAFANGRPASPGRPVVPWACLGLPQKTLLQTGQSCRPVRNQRVRQFEWKQWWHLLSDTTRSSSSGSPGPSPLRVGFVMTRAGADKICVSSGLSSLCLVAVSLSRCPIHIALERAQVGEWMSASIPSTNCRSRKTPAYGGLPERIRRRRVDPLGRIDGVPQSDLGVLEDAPTRMVFPAIKA